MATVLCAAVVLCLGCGEGLKASTSVADSGMLPSTTVDAAEELAVAGSGHGTLIYRRNSIELLPSNMNGSAARLAVQVLGLSNVEVLQELPTGEFAASILSAPPLDAGVARETVGIAVHDMNGDGFDDVLVMDTLGNWLAVGQSDGSFVGTYGDPLVHSFPPTPELAVFTVGGSEVLVGSLVSSFEAATRIAPAASWGQPFNVAVVAPWIRTTVTPQFFAFQAADAGSIQLAFLGSARLNLFDLSLPAIPALSTLTQSAVSPPYVAAFDGFDHLQVLSLSGCAPSAIGVGVFSSSTGVPRRLEQVTLQSTTYATQELPTPFDVVSCAVVSDPNGDDIVGVLGEQGGSGIFAAYRVTGCSQWTSLGAVATDFAWRSPSPSAVPKNNGVQILGWQVTDPMVGASQYRFVHYDGYDVRVWEIEVTSVQPPAATFNFRKSAVHAERSDLAPF